MTIEEWEKIANAFYEIDSEFLFAYSDYNNASNKKDRDKTLRKVYEIIDTADKQIRNHSEVYNLYTGGDNVTAYGRSNAYEDFRTLRYFSSNLNKLQILIKEKVQELSS